MMLHYQIVIEVDTVCCKLKVSNVSQMLILDIIYSLLTTLSFLLHLTVMF